ncbi:uncharacterized protein [Pseudorasbora parva]|uniref:uncharacterized protein isoform X1 n=1 Tax=Pseudorasbora parva TaxID=51549 RepID=UPI00351F48DE
MKNFLLFFLLPLFIEGMFGESVTVTVTVGDSVTLHTGLIEIKEEDLLEWRFGAQRDRIARVRKDSKPTTYDVPDGRFGDRLKADGQTGDLTITNITSEHAGPYEISNNTKVIITFKFVVVSADKHPSVLVGEFVTLPTGVTDTKTYDVMRWRFEDQKSPIAEVNRMTGNVSYDGAGEKFKDRLQMDYWTGSLTITSTRNTDSGKYEVDLIKSSKYTIHKSFTVTVRGEIKSVSVKEGESIALNTDSEIQRHDSAMWMFEDNILVSIQNNFINLGPDERFRDRLQLDSHTGSLTIMNTRITDSGYYTQTISSSKRIIHNKFRVTVNDSGSGSGSGLSAVAAGIFAVFFGVAAGVVIYQYRRISKLQRQIQETLPGTGESEDLKL